MQHSYAQRASLQRHLNGLFVRGRRQRDQSLGQRITVSRSRSTVAVSGAQVERRV